MIPEIDFKAMTSDELETLVSRIDVELRERDPGNNPPPTAMSTLVNAIQASKSGTMDVGVSTPFRETVLLRITLLDPPARH